MDTVLRLRELRRMRGLSQETAARAAGIGVKTLSSFETGARITSLKLGQLLALLRAYDMKPVEFFGGQVERDVFAELERLKPDELPIVLQLRELPDRVRVQIMEKILLMIDTAKDLTNPAKLRVVR